MELCWRACLFISIYSSIWIINDAAGFANLDLGTVSTRALKITNLTTLRTMPPSLQLYPQLTFTNIDHGATLNVLFYITNNNEASGMECSAQDFTLGAWRQITASSGDGGTGTHRKVAELQLETAAVSYGKVFCGYSISGSIQAGDILGILYGGTSSLLHEIKADPQIQIEVLNGKEMGDLFVPGPSEAGGDVQLGYPLISFYQENTVSGLLGNQLLGNILTSFTHSNSIFSHDFTCSGRINSWLIGGVPGEPDGNQFTLNQFRNTSQVAHAYIGISDIVPTDGPNMYRINTTASQFELENRDRITITYSTLSDNPNEFTINSINFEITEEVNNLRIASQSFITDFPLLSLEITNGDCDGNIFYNPATLANRALLLQDIMYPPFPSTPPDVDAMGYIYFFPNISFTEEGFIFQWRFAARTYTIDTDTLQYPSLQVWRRDPDEQTLSLVSASTSSSAPTLFLGTLNIYSYDVNISYEAGDFIALYQPPLDNTQYQLAFVDSRTYAEPIHAYQRQTMNAESILRGGQSLTDPMLSSHLVEPVISILSTSMPNDGFATDGIVTHTSTAAIVTSQGTVSSSSGFDRSLAAGLTVGTIVTTLVVIIVVLLIILCMRYKRKDQVKSKARTEGKEIPENEQDNSFNESGTYAVVRNEIPTHSTYHKSGAQAYEVPVNSASAASASSILNEVPALATHYEMPTSSTYVNAQFHRQESKNSMYLPPPSSWKPGSYTSSGSPRAPEVLYEVESLTNTGSGLLSPDSEPRDNGGRRNQATSKGYINTVKVYEVPLAMEKTAAKSPHTSGSKEQWNGESFYVPTKSERAKFSTDSNAISNIYYALRESQQSTVNSAPSFFEESDRFWEPAGDTDKLYQQMAIKKYREIPRNQIKQTVCLGGGNFGTVCKGVWKRSKQGDGVAVAVKTLNKGMQEKEKLRFLQEGAVNGQFHHPNVVKMYGMVTVGEPVMIVLEYLPNGDLCQYLHQNRLNMKGSSQLPKMLLEFCQHIAAGMDYLSRKAFVHRDLAARNVLLTENQTCKITDFGLSRDLEEDSYYISHGGPIPVRWTAIEALSFRKYSTASDVWSFGVVMYEIWSLGHKPFADYENAQVVALVREGHRLKPPPGCPSEVYRMMMKCWHPEASRRPSFSSLLSSLCKFETELQSEGRSVDYTSIGSLVNEQDSEFLQYSNI